MAHLSLPESHSWKKGLEGVADENWKQALLNVHKDHSKRMMFKRKHHF